MEDTDESLGSLCRVFLNARKMKCVNCTTCLGITFTNLIRYIIANDDGDEENESPPGLFLLQTCLILVHCTLIICGELKIAPNLTHHYPVFQSRIGRGIVIILISVPLFIENKLVVLTVSLFIMIGLLNIFLGWNDPPFKLILKGKPN